MADDEIDVKIVAKTDDLKSGLNDAASSVDKTAEQMKSSLGGASETIAEKIKGLQAGLNEATGGITGALTEITEAFSGFFGGLVVFEVGKEIVETFEKIGEAIAGVAEQGDELLKAGQKTGIAVEQLSQLKYAGGLADVEFGSMETALTRLSVNMDKAASGSGDAAGAFKALGISVTDNEGHLKPLDTMIDELANKFASLEDGPAKAALAVAIFGRAGTQLIPLLDQGGAAIDRLKQEAIAFGVTFSGEAAEFAEQFNDNLRRMDAAGSGLWQTFVERLLPAFSDLFNQIANILGNAPLLKTAIEGIGVSFGVVVLAIDAVIMGLRQMVDVVSIAYHAFTDPLQTIGVLINDIITGNVQHLGTDFAAASNAMKQNFTKDLADMKDSWDTYQAATKKVFGLTGLDDDKEKKPAAPIIPDSSGGDAVGKSKQAGYDDGLQMMKENLQQEMAAQRQADVEQINDTKSLSDEKLAIKQMDLDHAKQMGQLSVEDGRKQEEDLVTAQYQIDKQAADQEINLASTTEARKSQLRQQELKSYQKLQQDLHQIDLQADTQKAAADKKSTQQQEQLWRGMLSPFRSTFQEMTNGVLQGTETWKQAWASLGTNMVTSMANAGEQILENLIINTIEGLAIQKTANNQSILGNAKAAFTGAYNSASAIPYVGWVLGPIAGAAAFAACLAMSYDVGTGSVPADMQANIHRGEIIVPATMSDSIRSGQLTLGGPGGGSGGGGGNNFGPIHVSGALSAQQGMQTGRNLLKGIQSALRDNPSFKLA